jgi:CheY-like chemotaxis protein
MIRYIYAMAAETRQIFVVDDDGDDLELIEEAHKELGIERPLRLFNSSQTLLEHLRKSQVHPFLILSDLNMPKMNGFQLRQAISELSDTTFSKNIPFIFWSTASNNSQVKKAFDLNAQGFFLKEPNFDKLKATYAKIIDYWDTSQHPESGNP